MIQEIPKHKYKKEQILHTYRKQIETENGLVNLSFKIIRLTQDQLDSFQGVLVAESFNSELLVIQKNESIDTETGEVTEHKWGVCDHMGYIMEAITHYLHRTNVLK